VDCPHALVTLAALSSKELHQMKFSSVSCRGGK
jgi:hypothetical protein